MPNNTSSWAGQSKGSPLGYRIFIWILNNFGLSVGYFFSKMVACYYFFTATDSKTVLHDFYMQMGFESKSKRNRLIYKNFCMMGEVLIDKMSFAKGIKNKLTFSNEGEENIGKLLQGGRGVFLVGGHVGSWDVAAQFLKVGAKVNIVTYQNEKENIEKAIGDKKNSFNIIPLTEDIGFIISINEAIKRNEIICINVDRAMNDSSDAEFDFLGRAAAFPTGIYKLAQKLKSPIAFISGVKISPTEYFLNCKPLASEDNQKPEELANQFKMYFEQLTKSYPEQWFNHFNFWENNKLR